MEIVVKATDPEVEHYLFVTEDVDVACKAVFCICN